MAGQAQELLKACRCGGTAEIITVEEDGSINDGGMAAECKKCGITTRLWFPLMDDPTPAIVECWNKCPTEDRLREIIGGLVKRADWLIKATTSYPHTERHTKDLLFSAVSLDAYIIARARRELPPTDGEDRHED